MSQIYKPGTGGTPPPSVPTQFTADDGTEGVPVANNLNLLSRETSDNNIEGIQTTADPDGSDNFYIELTNRVSGTVQTTNATPTNLLTFTAPAVAGGYDIEIKVVVYDTTDTVTGTYRIDGAAQADAGGNIIGVGTPSKTYNGSTNYNVAQVDVTTSTNNLIVQVTGITLKTARWTGLLTYVYGGA